MARLLVIGIDPALAERLAGPAYAEIRKAGREANETLARAGHEVETVLVPSAAAAPAMVREALGRGPVDVVMVGGGLRLIAANTELFEAVMNAVHAAAPGARLAFNTHPSTTPDAVARALARG